MTVPASSTPTAPGPSWRPPLATGPLKATVTVPGSKSQTARRLILAALGDGESRLRAPLHARDTELMAGALRALGHAVEPAADEPGDWVVRPNAAAGAPSQTVAVDVGNSGTVTRFVPALAALGHRDVLFDGDPRVRERPVGPLLDALRSLGAEIEDGGRGALPLTVRGAGAMAGGEVSLDASSSSQLVTGLLLAAPRTERGVVVQHTGPRMPSQPYLAMTVAELRAGGAEVDVDASTDGRSPAAAPTRWSVRPSTLQARDAWIEPDLNSALPFLVAPLVAGGSVTLAHFPADSEQPGALLPELLTRLGAVVTVEDTADGGRLTVAAGDGVRGIDADDAWSDFADFGEAVPVLTALALFADGPTTIRGVEHLRKHETDRLTALAEELGKLGADVRETADGLVVVPVARLHGAELDPRADHRLAMAYAVAALRVPGITVSDPATVAKTMPDFVDRWSELIG